MMVARKQNVLAPVRCAARPAATLHARNCDSGSARIEVHELCYEVHRYIGKSGIRAEHAYQGELHNVCGSTVREPETKH